MKFPNIEAERARSGFTITELCDQIGVSKQTYHNWQRGNNDMPVAQLKKLSIALNAPMDYLAEGGE